MGATLVEIRSALLVPDLPRGWTARIRNSPRTSSITVTTMAILDYIASFLPTVHAEEEEEKAEETQDEEPAAAEEEEEEEPEDVRRFRRRPTRF